MHFCEKHELHLISDEVYALSVHTNDAKDLPNFTSVLSFDLKGLMNEDHLHVLYGMSKVCPAFVIYGQTSSRTSSNLV